MLAICWRQGGAVRHGGLHAEWCAPELGGKAEAVATTESPWIISLTCATASSSGRCSDATTTIVSRSSAGPPRLPVGFLLHHHQRVSSSASWSIRLLLILTMAGQRVNQKLTFKESLPPWPSEVHPPEDARHRSGSDYAGVLPCNGKQQNWGGLKRCLSSLCAPQRRGTTARAR